MNASELAKTISLDPRAAVLTGTLRERVKTSETGQISGFTPHHTMRGCPPLQFTAAGEPVASYQEAVAIEADFTEQQVRPELAAVLSGYGRALNMVHLMFGRNGAAANAAEAKVLKEAGEIFRQAVGQPTHLVALPILSSAAYGVAQGRLVALGLFRQTGEALWLHPAAVGSLLRADYPASQFRRSLIPAPVETAPVAPKVNWYELLSATLAKSTKFSGTKLHNLVLGSYADQLILSGRAADKQAALELARKEFDALKGLNSAPLPKPQAPAARLSKARV